ncbi:MAG: hypothetical protein ACT4OO_08715 [Nitrospiraceae bacterium]
MDSHQVQKKIETVAQRLLLEAEGDPIRALGLLIVILDGSDITDDRQIIRLLSEVRKVLVPQLEVNSARIIQHLAGERSWEGIQHCLRCGAVLPTEKAEGGSFPSGYVYHVNGRFCQGDYEDFDRCV